MAEQGNREDEKLMKAGGGRHREAGLGRDGEPSKEALQRWLFWAGIALAVCFLTVCILAVVFLAENRKPAIVMELEAEDSLELVLNRKGAVLEVSERTSGWQEDATAERLDEKTLKESCELLLGALHTHGYLDSDGAALITVRQSDDGSHVNLRRVAESIGMYAESFLKGRQSKGTVYVGSVKNSSEAEADAVSWKTSFGRSALIGDLLQNNSRVKTSDAERLGGLPVKELVSEIKEEKYVTSFLVVTAGRIYQEKTPEEVLETEPEEEDENTRNDTEGAEDTESADGAGDSGNGSGGQGNADGNQNRQPGAAEQETGQDPEAVSGESEAKTDSLEDDSELNEERAEEGREEESLAAEEVSRAEEESQAEAERLAAEEASQAEAERLAAEEASRAEAERLAAEEASRAAEESRAAESSSPISSGMLTPVGPETSEASSESQVQPPTETTASLENAGEESKETAPVSVPGGPKYEGPGFVQEVIPVY